MALSSVQTRSALAFIFLQFTSVTGKTAGASAGETAAKFIMSIISLVLTEEASH